MHPKASVTDHAVVPDWVLVNCQTRTEGMPIKKTYFVLCALYMVLVDRQIQISQLVALCWREQIASRSWGATNCVSKLSSISVNASHYQDNTWCLQRSGAESVLHVLVRIRIDLDATHVSHKCIFKYGLFDVEYKAKHTPTRTSICFGILLKPINKSCFIAMDVGNRKHGTWMLINSNIWCIECCPSDFTFKLSSVFQQLSRM